MKAFLIAAAVLAAFFVGQNVKVTCNDVFPFCTVTTPNSFTVVKK